MTRRPFEALPASQQAGMLCNDPKFQEYAAMRSGFPGGQFNASATAQYLRTCCRIQSRRDLNTNEGARTLFHQLRTSFDAWAGRIAAPR